MKTMDLCCGIGGIRRGFELAGGFENVLSAEKDEYACKTYQHLFGDDPRHDVTDESFKKLAERTEYDVLLAGFPCQAFSRIGLKQGFRDVTKGTIFFDIAEIIDRTMPKVVFLENVENLVSHDKGQTFKTIINTLENELASPEQTESVHSGIQQGILRKASGNAAEGNADGGKKGNFSFRVGYSATQGFGKIFPLIRSFKDAGKS